MIVLLCFIRLIVSYLFSINMNATVAKHYTPERIYLLG